MSIKQLPQDAIDKIKSTVTITSLNAVVSSLIKNSLDAAATKIHVTFDYLKGDCSVEDNGHGILPGEFDEDGGLGKLHHTSKHPASPAVHGCRGDFLAALAGLSLLHIVSRHVQHVSHNALLVHNGRVLSRNCPAPDEQRLRTFEHGTRVVVRNLFGGLPVRVKRRALISTEAAAKSRMWFELLEHTVASLLSWPSEVMILLRDADGDREHRLQAPPATASLATRTSTLLMQAALADSDDERSWVPVSSFSRQVSVSGCFSLHPMPSRRSQFLSLGIQPVDNAYGSNILLEEINRVFKDSSFGSREEDTPFFQSERKLKDRQSRRSPDKHPMFYLRIDVHATGEERMSEDSLYAGDSQILEVILGLLRAVSYGFLKSHQFKPQKVAMSNANSPMSTARKLSKSSRRPEGGSGVSQAVRTTVSPSDNAGRPSSPFDGWNRVKVGAASGLHSKTSLAASFNKARLVGADGTVLRRPFQEFPIEAATTQTSSSDVATSQAELGRHDAASDPTSSELTEPQTRQELQGPGSGWLAEVVQSWENPIFEIAQQAVPMTYSDTCAPGESSHHWAGNGATLLDSASIGLKRRLRKDNLLGAEVISQVDKKFILIRLPSHNTREGNTPTDTTLVMLDQHAADERCQLEDLMAGYFYQDASGSYIANSEPLEKPIVIEMTRSEILLLQQYSQHLQDWGVTYTVQSGKAAENGTGHGDTLWIENLPPSIAERCRTEPKLLVDILRQEIWRLHDAGSVQLRPRGQPDSTPNRPWVGLFRGCPRGILDLLHSRSCRSAIMFNDPLSNADCAHLIERLSRCAFPFQCAHGRPSMAPVLDLGTEPWSNAWTGEEPVEARRARWKAWMET